MPLHLDAAERLQQLPGATVLYNVPLATYTRFGIGGPATVFFETTNAEGFVQALALIRQTGLPHVVLGGGTNLIVSDAGFEGIVLRFCGNSIRLDGSLLQVDAGASLQAVVDFSILYSLRGAETLTGIPGSLGAAVYGNAGAYGHSIQELVDRVIFANGNGMSQFGNAECEFRYRESAFKTHKDWVILAASLRFEPGDGVALRKKADEIRSIRDAKYPPTMKCAGSIFKNCFYAELPQNVQTVVPETLIREGKVPSAFFLEAVNAKGMRRGDIQVATYHANLIYNDGAGTADDLVALIQELKERVGRRFGFDLEEEVQFVGFDQVALSAN